MLVGDLQLPVDSKLVDVNTDGFTKSMDATRDDFHGDCDVPGELRLGEREGSLGSGCNLQVSLSFALGMNWPVGWSTAWA